MSSEAKLMAFVFHLQALVDDALKQLDAGYAVDVEEHLLRIAKMAADHRRLVYPEGDALAEARQFVAFYAETETPR